ncbi:hypothetical protein ACLQ26_20075 [Micromonospora sp. DT43]|uniref:hypothetical protein n=1 Tax=Micromonospora sp. DT43 TaxID=3393440 RepID=UPI003CED8370
MSGPARVHRRSRHRLPDVTTMPAAAGVFALLTVDAVITGIDGIAYSVRRSARQHYYAVRQHGPGLAQSRGTGLGDAKLILSVTALLG